MSTELNLKEIERKAFRSTYQDGLLDLEFGLVMVCMSIFIYRPASGYSPLNIILAVCAISVANLLFWLGKKFITLPRMGQVRFGPQRTRRKRTLVIVMSAIVLIQVILLALQFLALAKPGSGAILDNLIPERTRMDLLVASIAALIVGPGMFLMAYFTDFLRGYYIALLFSLAVFLMVYLNQPVYPIVIGILVAIPGLVLFIRFLKAYPLPREGMPDA
jgi:hypothetical protein